MGSKRGRQAANVEILLRCLAPGEYSVFYCKGRLGGFEKRVIHVTIKRFNSTVANKTAVLMLKASSTLDGERSTAIITPMAHKAVL